MKILIALCVGCLLGYFVTMLGFTMCIKGTLFCITEDEQPYVFVELDKSVENIASHKFVIFRTSQKKQRL